MTGNGLMTLNKEAVSVVTPMNDIDCWVHQVNALASKMDEIAASLHPSAWPETLREENEQFKKLAARKPL